MLSFTQPSDHQPSLIAPDALTNAKTEDAYAWCNNRRLSPLVAFPRDHRASGLYL